MGVDDVNWIQGIVDIVAGIGLAGIARWAWWYMSDNEDVEELRYWVYFLGFGAVMELIAGLIFIIEAINSHLIF